MKMNLKTKKPEHIVRKPFLTGSPADENTLKSSAAFFGSLLLVYFMSFMLCSFSGFGNAVIGVVVNVLVIGIMVIVFFNNGTNQGADAVARGEILYQKEQKGLPFSDSERSVCYHPMKGFLTGLLGTLPLIVIALVFALNVQIIMTDSGTLPSWMQTYLRRADIGNALVQYTQTSAMSLTAYLRIIVRIALIPFVTIIGTANSRGLLVLERLSPILVLIPAVSYGSGYLTGRGIRTKVHTAISENDRRRVRKERKARKARRDHSAFRPPEKLN